MKICVAPSILSADFGKLNEEIASVEEYIDYIHVDVMDGHFVPNLTIGPPVVKCIKTSRPLDVHMMVSNPEMYIDDFAAAGTAVLTAHQEAVQDAHEFLTKVKSAGMNAGLSVKPNTRVEVLESVIDELDWVLIMSVEPGFGGQAFMENSLEKIKWLRDKRSDLPIAVDGGINAETARRCVEAGADVLVAGSYIFKASNRADAIKSLRS